MGDRTTRAKRHPDSTVIQKRLLVFPGGRRFSGRAAKALYRKMRGQTGAICDIRNPPLLARGVSIDRTGWPVTQVEFAHLPSRKVPYGTMAPFGVRLRPGTYHVALCSKGGGLVKSASFEVVRGHVTMVTAFPPTTFVVGSANVRRTPTVEVNILPED